MTFQELSNRFSLYGQLIRWDKPIGTLLLLWPTLTALLFASHGHPTALLIFVFVAGVFVMRAAGCIINDLTDRKFDKFVLRTKNRPLTTGKISIQEALILLLFLLILAFLLSLFLNLYTIVLAIFGLFITLIYPWLKRVTYLPQLGIGVAFSWGIPMAYTAQIHRVPYSGWLFFLIVLLWTINYDTMYAIVDREDDQRIGIQSTAILFAGKEKWIIGLLQTIVITLLVFLGMLLKLNFWFYLGIFSCFLSFCYQQLLLQDLQPTNCFKAFLNNHWSLFFIFFASVLALSS